MSDRIIATVECPGIQPFNQIRASVLRLKPQIKINFKIPLRILVATNQLMIYWIFIFLNKASNELTYS